jgi:hypothetical protein
MRDRAARRRFATAGLPIAGLVVALLAIPVQAGSITYVTPAGSTTGGGPVNDEAVFTTTAGSLSITLTNLQANPTDVAQLLSDLSFTLGGGNLTGATLTSSSGQEVTVAKDGSFTLGSTVSTGWAFGTSAGTGTLDVLGTPTGPSHLIIGPPGAGGYTNANGSIAGNKPHNPFLNESATFTITGSGITDTTTITAVTFSFGTTAGITVDGIPLAAVPEPSSLALGLAGIGVVACVRLYRSRRKA